VRQQDGDHGGDLFRRRVAAQHPQDGASVSATGICYHDPFRIKELS
jgi:hypothetical protein